MRYIAGLDGLRAISVLLVLAFHAGIPMFSRGYLGVPSFFVLSGYLITRRLRDEYIKYGRIDLRSFYLRRAARLLPAAFAFSLPLLFLPKFLGTQAETVRICRDQIGASMIYVNNLWQVHQREGCRFTAHHWSLSVEEQFYFFWPISLVLFIRLATRRKPATPQPRGRHSSPSVPKFVYRPLKAASALLVAFVVLNVIFGRSENSARWALVTTVPFAELLIGAILGEWVSIRKSVMHARRLGTFAGLFALSALSWAPTNGVLGGSLDVWWSFHGGRLLVAFAIVTLVVTQEARSSKLLSWRPLVYIGKRSYGIYLLHFPLLVGAADALHTPLDANTRNTWIARLLGSAATFGIASLSFRLFEAPIVDRVSRSTRNRLAGNAVSRSVPRALGN